MGIVKRVLVVGGLAVAALGYVWIAAVRAVPGVKRRRAERRAERRR